jgi:hypothetical protein
MALASIVPSDTPGQNVNFPMQSIVKRTALWMVQVLARAPAVTRDRIASSRTLLNVPGEAPYKTLASASIASKGMLDPIANTQTFSTVLAKAPFKTMQNASIASKRTPDPIVNLQT